MAENPLRIYLVPPKKLIESAKGKRVAKKAKKAKKKTAKKRVRLAWTRADVAEFRRHSKAKTPVAKLVKIFKRNDGTLRQKARTLGIQLGHTKRRKLKR